MSEVSGHLVNKKDIGHTQRKSVAKSFFSGQGTFFFQPKLTISAPDDSFEKEADAVADQVMRMSDNQVFPAHISPVGVQRMCAECEKEKENIQRKTPSLPTREAPAEVHQAIHSNGQAMDKGTQSFMENRFGYDFSQVKIHTDTVAAKSADAIHALAYTSGNHIVFNEGQFAPATDSGKRLLAHELTHVVQQTPVIQRFTNQHFIDAGCAPHTNQSALQADFDRAEEYVNATITAMQASPISDSTRRSIRWYFHRERDTQEQDILNNLQNILEALRLSDNLGSFACQPAGGACRSRTLAYVQPGNVAPGEHAFVPINLCPNYFGGSAKERAESLIHEAAHLVGMSVGTDDVYDHTHRFRSLPTSEALLNADSYALFASSITEGVPVGFVFSVGGTGGPLLGSPSGEAGWFASAFVDATLQHPRLYLFNPSLRFSMGLMGLPTSGEPGASAPTPTLVYSLLPGFRIEDPRPSGGTGFFSFRGGPTLNLGSAGVDVGAEVGVDIGYRWRWLQLSAGASYNFDPTAPAGSEHLVRLGPTISFDFSRSN